MIVYNDIYEALRKERYSEQLQLLSKKFILDVAEYISEKRKVIQNQASTSTKGPEVFSDEIIKLQKQVENSQAIFKELIMLRKKKLLGLVFVASETGINKKDFENMLDFEKELFDKIIEAMEAAEKKIVLEFVNSGADVLDKDLKMILILEDIEELIGMDGEQIGPFKKNDIVNLPIQIADILVSDKKAELVFED